MATYFKPEYQEYYDTLSDSHSVSVESKNIESMIDEVKAEFGAVYGMIDELQGEFTGELYGSIEGLKDELSGAAAVLGILDQVTGVIEDLGSQVVSLHDEDPKYEEKQEEYDTKKDSPPSPKYEDGSTTIKTENYSTWEYNLGVIKEALDELITLCEELQINCDTDINLIDSFNNAVIDLRLKLVAFTVSGGDMAIEDIANMSVEAKQAYLEDLIRQLEKKYEDYKKIYEDAFKILDEFPEGSDAYDCIYYLLSDINPGDEMDFIGAFTGKDYVTRGMRLISFIESMSRKIEGTDITYMECFTSYLSGEKSFEESGMFELVKLSGKHNFVEGYKELFLDKGEIDWNQYIGMVEEDFCRGIFTNNTGRSLYDPELRSLSFQFLNKLVETKDIFEENYAKQLNTGTMIKGTRKLKESIFYDDIRVNDPAYAAYEYDRDYFVDFQDESIFSDNKGYVKGDLVDTYNMLLNDSDKLSENEKKMLGYLFSTGKYDEAVEYGNIIQNGINMREGAIRAEEMYNSLIAGGDVFQDQVFDDVRAYWEGTKKGVGSYVEGLYNLIDPSKDPSPTDYYYMELTKLLKQDVFQITGNGNARFTVSQSADYIRDQGYNPLCPDKMTISGNGVDATDVTYTGENAWIDSSGNVVNDLSGYKYDSERKVYVSLDESVTLCSVPTFSDSRGNVRTLGEWESLGYDTVNNRTYGTGDDAIHIDKDSKYSMLLSGAYTGGESATKAAIKFVEDYFCPGLGTLTFAASDIGNAIEDSMQGYTIAYMDLNDGSDIDNSDNTFFNAAMEYVSDPGNVMSAVADLTGGVAKLKVLEGSPFADFCQAISDWTDRTNKLYGVTTSDGVGSFYINSGKLVMSMIG